VPQQMPMVGYGKCQPEKCDEGICLAVLACPNKVLKQEAPYEVPVPNPAMCVGCGTCVQTCPLKAIRMM
jgi:NAD-dependent dihydropyrimidine dehydrogenase PreA subunit